MNTTCLIRLDRFRSGRARSQSRQPVAPSWYPPGVNSTAWTAVGAIAAAATFFTYVAILIYAVKQVREAQRLRFETERLRRSQWRPFVVVDVEPGWILYLTIENIGTTLARNVQFSFHAYAG